MMMTRRQRLMATLRGEPVDRPAVNFYEIGGWVLDPDDPDPFNVCNGPGWRELIQLAESATDLIRMMTPEAHPTSDNPVDAIRHVETIDQGDKRFTRTVLQVGNKTLTSTTRRDRDVATSWTIEPLLKGPEDLDLYLSLPAEIFAYTYDVAPLQKAEEALGDAGIVMVDVADPLCRAASLFDLEMYTIVALTEPRRFHALLEKLAPSTYAMVTAVCERFPGHLWRIVGSEYASDPLLPPRLYREYEVRYTQPIVTTIQQSGGFARLHSHGRLRRILPDIMEMGVDGLDPIEPPPQGDMTLEEVQAQIGAQTVLFGNIEVSELQQMAPETFEVRVREAVQRGSTRNGRGFVLMPTSCPYGRTISERLLQNYKTMIRTVETCRT